MLARNSASFAYHVALSEFNESSAKESQINESNVSCFKPSGGRSIYGIFYVADLDDKKSQRWELCLFLKSSIVEDHSTVTNPTPTQLDQSLLLKNPLSVMQTDADAFFFIEV